MIPRLGDDLQAPFPAPESALDQPDGLLAWGGDLAPERLVTAYREGIFPWYTDDDPILWWSPSMRCVMPTDAVHVSRRLARTLRQAPYQLSMDRAFRPVVEACARTRDATWITPDMVHGYTRLHELGIAHSIEAWDGERLVGGLYGLSLGRMFFGESMYSAARDASKVALVALCRCLADWDFPWMDCQVSNPHLQRMGAFEIPRDKYIERLARLVDRPGLAGAWTERFAAAQDGV